MKVCDKTCIFFFFPIISKYFLMAKRSLLSRCPSYIHKYLDVVTNSTSNWSLNFVLLYIYYIVLCGCPYIVSCVVNCNLYLTCPLLHVWLNGWTNKPNQNQTICIPYWQVSRLKIAGSRLLTSPCWVSVGYDVCSMLQSKYKLDTSIIT